MTEKNFQERLDLSKVQHVIKLFNLKMKLFQELHKMVPILVGYKNLRYFDSSAPNLFRKYLYGFTNRLGYFVFVSSVVLAAGSFAFEAKTLQEYSDSFYAFITLLNDTFYFIYMQWLCNDIFELNEDYEKMIAKRKLIISMEFSNDDR